MVRSNVLTAIAAFCHAAHAACPYMDGGSDALPAGHPVARRDGASDMSTDKFMGQFEIDDSKAYLTNPVGGAIPDQESLSAGERGPSLLEDQIFRRKIMHFGKSSLTATISDDLLTGTCRS
jgi:catalase